MNSHECRSWFVIVVINDRGDKLGLSLHVCFDITSTLPGECSFQLRILTAIIGMTTKVVSQNEVISQGCTALDAYVEMMGEFQIATIECLSSLNAEISFVRITQPSEKVSNLWEVTR